MRKSEQHGAGLGGPCPFLQPPMSRQSKVFRPPIPHDDRQRDLFPLPLLVEEPEVAKKSLSRSVKQRIHRRRNRQRRLNSAVVALNSLFYGKDLDSAKSCINISDLPRGQGDVLRSLIHRLKVLGPPPAVASYREALQALQVPGGSYEAEPGVGETVPMDLSSLSLPTLSGTGVDLEREMSGSIGDMIRDFEGHLLQDATTWASVAEEAARMKPYNDPKMHHKGFYRDFLLRLQSCGILTFSRRARGRVGAFSVSKKPKVIDGQLRHRQRLILDCRQVNFQFRAPPLTELGSLAALCEIEIGPGETVYTGGADIADCFYGCRLPIGMESFFCFKEDLLVRDAKALFPEMPEWIHGLAEDSVISPCLSVLPMGFSWSFYIVQQLHEQITMQALSIDRRDLILDSHPARELRRGTCLAMPYCDNVHVIGKESGRVEQHRLRVCECLREKGFQVHEEVPASAVVPTLGGIVDGHAGLVRATPSRLWKIIIGFEYCLRKPVSSEFVRRLLGHAMVLCVLNRCGMAIFRSLYDFSAKGLGPCRLWKSAARECRMFIAVAPLLQGNLRREWSSRVTCTDASPEGYGIVECELRVDQVREIGQWNERWRFKRLPVSEWRPRERAFNYDVVSDLFTAGRPEPTAGINQEYVENEEFVEVPFQLMKPSRWHTAKIGMWKNTSEHISLKEGRCFVLALRRLSRDSKQRGRKLLIFVDNLALGMAVSKGRAHDFHMLRVCQQVAAISLASDLFIRPRWVPSEVNPADGPSRGSLHPNSDWQAVAEWRRAQAGEAESGTSDGSPEGSFGQPPEHGDWSLESVNSDGEGEARLEDTQWSLFRRFKDQEEAGGSEVNKNRDDRHYVGRACFRGKNDQAWKREGFKERGGDGPEHDSPRDGKCQRSPAKSIHEVPELVQGLLPGARDGVASGQPRLGPGGLLRRHVFGRELPCRGGEDHCSGGISFHRGKERAFESAQGFEGVEKATTAYEPAPIAETSHLWNCDGSNRKGAPGYGCQDARGLRPLPTPRGEPRRESQTRRTSSAKVRETVSEVCCDHPGSGVGAPRQDGDLRQHDPARQPGNRKLAWPSPSSHGQESDRRIPGVSVFSRGLSEAVPECRGGHRTEASSSIPASTWRSERGSELQDPRSCGSPRAGSLENRLQLAPLCQDGETSEDARRAEGKPPRILPTECASHAEGLGRHTSGSASLEGSSWRTWKRKMMVEVFSGTGRISQAVRDLHVPCFPIDISNDPRDDVLSAKTRGHLYNVIKSGRVVFVWISMPCISLKPVHKSGDELSQPYLYVDRSGRSFHHGGHQLRSVRTQQALLQFSASLIKLCRQFSVAWTFENPWSSLCWEARDFVQLRQHSRFGVLDFCQFGKPYRMRTGLLYEGIDLSFLERRCSG